MANDITIQADLGALKTAASDFKAWNGQLDTIHGQLLGTSGALSASWQDANTEKRSADLQKLAALIKELQNISSQWSQTLGTVIQELEASHSKILSGSPPSFSHV